MCRNKVFETEVEIDLFDQWYFTQRHCATPDLDATSVGAKCEAEDCAEKYFGAKNDLDA